MSKQKPTENYQIKVLLYQIEPLIWRELSVPSSCTFAEFHQILQAAMGWERKHLHEFRHGKGRNLTSVIATADEEIVQGDDFRDESETTLREIVGRKHFPFRMLYRYDFTDEWIHEITFMQKLEATGKVELLDGDRNCPPEDCGGAFGYQSCVDGELDWMDDSYNPRRFDKTAAVERIKTIKLS